MKKLKRRNADQKGRMPMKKGKMDEDKIAIYDSLIALCPEIERMGKSMLYTSANGYMFSLLNKAGEFGIRFSKEDQKKYMETWNSTFFKSYGATMQGYVLVPDSFFDDLDTLAQYLNESYNYVMSLEPK